MKRSKSACQLHRFVSIHDSNSNLFNVPRYDIPFAHHRELRSVAMQTWRQIACLTPHKSDPQAHRTVSRL